VAERLRVAGVFNLFELVSPRRSFLSYCLTSLLLCSVP